MPSTWYPIIDLLDPSLLTVEAQALPPLDRGDVLLWDTLLPREDVDSVKLYSVTTLDYRPAADRREWNARGRLIPAPSPPRRQVSIVPIEARDKIDEQEMQRLNESASGNAEIIRDIMGITIPKRTERLVDSVYRRLEVDAFTAWINGTITQRNPEDASKTYVASFGFDPNRYTTAGTAWDNAGVNAYTLLLQWIAAAEDMVGPIKGAMLRLATMNAILADAPNLPNNVVMTRSQIEERITQDKGTPFAFYINEHKVDVFNDGGTAYTRTAVFPAQRIAAIPNDGRIGRTAFAPVVRAMELAQQNGEAGIDVRGVTVYADEANGGRELSLEAQINALPVPEEQRCYVTNTGV